MPLWSIQSLDTNTHNKNSEGKRKIAKKFEASSFLSTFLLECRQKLSTIIFLDIYFMTTDYLVFSESVGNN